MIKGHRLWLVAAGGVKLGQYAQQTLEGGSAASAISYMWVDLGAHKSTGIGKNVDAVSANFDALLRAIAQSPQVAKMLQDLSDAPASV